MPSSRPDLKAIVEYALGKTLPWKDMDALLDEKARREYSDAAQLICETSVWRNELDRLIDEATKGVVTKASTYDEVQAAQTVIATLQLLKERFSYIASWNRKQTSSVEEDRFAPI